VALTYKAAVLHAPKSPLAIETVEAADLAASDVLVRVKNGRKLPALCRYRDGSYLSVLGTTRVRVIEAQITIATSAGRRGEYDVLELSSRPGEAMNEPYRRS